MKTYIKQILHLVYMVAIMSVLLSLQRFILYLANSSLFSEFPIEHILYTITKGFVYDVLLIVYTNILFIFLFLSPVKAYNSIFYQTLLKVIFTITNVLVTLINLIDINVYSHVRHRLTIFDVQNNLIKIWDNIQSASWQYFVKEYLSLVIYFVALLIIILLLTRFIKKRNFENKSSVVLLKVSNIVLILAISAVFANNIVYSKANFHKKLYLKSDRKLVAILVNNPYLLIAEYFNYEKELKLNDYWHINTYNPVNQHNITKKANKFDHIKIVVCVDKTYPISKKFNSKLNVINNYYDNVFQILDELLFSFPSIFRNGLYQSAYSLNNMESLVDIAKVNGYYTKFSSYGYEKETSELIQNFYRFNNYNNKDSSKTFELVLIKGKNVHSNTLSDFTKGNNNLIINILTAKKQEYVSKCQATKSISFHSDNKLNFYTNKDSIITQCLDIKPSVLHLMKHSKQFISYGNSLFKNNEKCPLHVMSDSAYCAFSDSLLLYFSHEQAISLHKMNNLKFSDYNFSDSLAVECTVIEGKLQSMIYDFKKRIVSNELCPLGKKTQNVF